MSEGLEVPEDFIKIQCPARIQCSGPTMIGKSHLILKLVKWRRQVFSVDMKRIMYFLPPNSMHTRRQYLNEMQSVFPHLEIYEGLPKDTAPKLLPNPDREPCLIILEDLADEMLKSGDMLSLFFVDSHHLNLTVIYTVQNLFHPSKFGKGISRCCSDFILFPQNDRYGMNIFCRTLFPKNPNLFNEAFDFLQEEFPKDRPYLVVDTNPISKTKVEKFRVRSRIFPEDESETVTPIYFSS